MRHHLVTAAILLAALVFYGLGFSESGAVAFGAGVAFELWFWVRIVRRKPSADVLAATTK